MKTRTIALVALILAFSGYFAAPAVASEAPRMEMDELKAKLGNPEVVIIDVRSYTDWLLSSDKIKGAVRENYQDFEGWSASLALKFIELGYPKVYALKGGWEGWKKAGYPIEPK